MGTGNANACALPEKACGRVGSTILSRDSEGCHPCSLTPCPTQLLLTVGLPWGADLNSYRAKTSGN